MLKLVGISLSVLLCSLLIKDNNRSFAVLLSLSGSVILLLAVAAELSEIVGKISDFTRDSKLSGAYIKLMLKALGITVLTQFVSNICRDNGENALASITETVSKIAVIAMVLPLFESIFSIVSGLLK